MPQRRASRTFSWDTLEGRELLSTLVAAHPSAEYGSIHAEKVTVPKVVTARGTLKGVAFAAPSATGANTNLTGQGKVSGLPGTLRLAATQATALAGTQILVSAGTGTFTPSGAPTGSLINMAYSGTGTVSKRGVVTLKVNGLLAGGAGAYAGQTGTFTGTVTISNVTSLTSLSTPFSMAVTIKLNPILKA